LGGIHAAFGITKLITSEQVCETVGLARRVLSSIDKDPIILSHHPLCGKFEDHFFRIRGRHVCIGCATVYPSAIITALLLSATDQNSFGIVFPIALSSFALNLLRVFDRRHRLSILFNTLLGISLGTSILSAIHAPGDLQPIVIIAGLAVAIVFAFLKGYRVLATCKSCERYDEFPYCHNPGSTGASGKHPMQPE